MHYGDLYRDDKPKSLGDKNERGNSMLHAEKVQEIAVLSPPILSAYFNTKPEDASRHPRVSPSMAWLQKEGTLICNTLAPPDADQFLREFRRVEEFIRDRHPEEKALAIFVGSATWFVFPLQVAVKDELAWGQPAIGQLFRLLHEHKPCCVVSIDHHAARFFVYSLGELAKLGEKKFEVDSSQWKEKNVSHVASGSPQKMRGPYPDRFEHHLEEQYARLCRETVEQVVALSKHNGFGHIFLAGPGRLIGPMQAQFPRTFEKSVRLVREDLGNFSPRELLQRLEPIIAADEQERQMTEVTRLLAAENGAVVDADEMLAMLQKGTIRSVVVSRDLDLDLRQCADCGLASSAADPVCAVCAGIRRKVAYDEVLPVLLAAHNTDVEIVSGEAARKLELMGGIGGWLRQIKVAATR